MQYSAIGCFVTLALTILLAPLASDGQTAATVPRIGVLLFADPATATRVLEPFRQGLRERNYVEGQDITIEYRLGERDDQLLDLATELVQRKVDIIVAWGVPAAKAAQQAARTIPIVAFMGDAVEMGLVASLAGWPPACWLAPSLDKACTIENRRRAQSNEPFHLTAGLAPFGCSSAAGKRWRYTHTDFARGRQRTWQEYEALFDRAGFSSQREVDTGTDISILEAVPA